MRRCLLRHRGGSVPPQLDGSCALRLDSMQCDSAVMETVMPRMFCLDQQVDVHREFTSEAVQRQKLDASDLHEWLHIAKRVGTDFLP